MAPKIQKFDNRLPHILNMCKILYVNVYNRILFSLRCCHISKFIVYPYSLSIFSSVAKYEALSPFLHNKIVHSVIYLFCTFPPAFATLPLLNPWHKVVCHSKPHHLFPDVSINLRCPLARLPCPLLLFEKEYVLHFVITDVEGQMNLYESHISSAHTRESYTDFSLQWHHSPDYTASPT